MIQTNIQKIRYYGRKYEKTNWEFRIFLKFLDKDEDEIDKIVHEINTEISERIDCTACANCCKEMSPMVRNYEIAIIARRFGISREEFTAKYLTKDNDEKKYFINKKPCPFLKNNRCEIYEYRPKDCKSYPHLWKKKFISRLFGVVNNYSVCPIVYNVYERLKTEFNFDPSGHKKFYHD